MHLRANLLDAFDYRGKCRVRERIVAFKLGQTDRIFVVLKSLRLNRSKRALQSAGPRRILGGLTASNLAHLCRIGIGNRLRSCLGLGSLLRQRGLD